MIAVVLFILLLIPLTAEAQSYDTLRMVRPIATGAAGTGLHASNRVYRAYQGIEYNIHADAHGGVWPYTYSLSNAPAGMTIEVGPCTTIGPTCTAGTISWPNPTSTASNIVVTIRDKVGTEVSGTWSVTVSTTIGTGGFCFIDAASGNDTTGSGSLAAPYQTLSKAHTSCGATSILYLRAGTYSVGGGTASAPEDCRNRYIWTEASQPAIWIGYPGETVTVNFLSTGSADGYCVKMSGQNMWFDNFRMDNVGSIGFQLDDRLEYGIVARRITGLDLLAGADSLNSAFFMWAKYSAGYSYFDTVQNSTFSNISLGAVALKVYTNIYGIYETSTYSDQADSTEVQGSSDGMISLKVMARDYDVRGNTCTATVQVCVGGNMNRSDAPSLLQTRGHIRHNLMLGSDGDTNEGSLTLTAGKIITPLTTQVYRNTFVGGRVLFANAVTSDGPYLFYNNVIVNAGGTGGSCPARLTCESVTDYGVTTIGADNVQGANDGTIANATTGVLVGASRITYLGVAGFELLASAGSGGVGGRGSFGGTGRLQ